MSKETIREAFFLFAMGALIAFGLYDLTSTGIRMWQLEPVCDCAQLEAGQ